jgi:hypothetical protein
MNPLHEDPIRASVRDAMRALYPSVTLPPPRAPWPFPATLPSHGHAPMRDGQRDALEGAPDAPF